MGWVNGLFQPEPYIVCVDCGGKAGLLRGPPGPEDPPLEPGEFLAYRCQDCNDRWDLEVYEPFDE